MEGASDEVKDGRRGVEGASSGGDGPTAAGGSWTELVTMVVGVGLRGCGDSPETVPLSVRAACSLSVTARATDAALLNAAPSAEN